MAGLSKVKVDSVDTIFALLQVCKQYATVTQCYGVQLMSYEYSVLSQFDECLTSYLQIVVVNNELQLKALCLRIDCFSQVHAGM